MIKTILAAEHLELTAIFQQQLATGLWRFTGTHLRQAFLLPQQSLQQDFNLATGGFLAKQPGRNDPGVVENEQITVLQQTWKLVEFSVLQATRAPAKAQQATGAAFCQRCLSD